MNIYTRREFSFINPQDDPQLYPKLPKGLEYTIYGDIIPQYVATTDQSKPAKSNKSNGSNKSNKIYKSEKNKASDKSM